MVAKRSLPDANSQSPILSLLQLATELDEERQLASLRGPAVVHCSAGLGRTGAFIGAYIGMWMLKEENSVDVLGILCQVRCLGWGL